MSHTIPDPSPELNRLRAAAALIPIIETGLNGSRLSSKRVAMMKEFCEWAAAQSPQCSEGSKLKESILGGLKRLE
jgi:hypothetical protein